ncbi:Gfo/Idh/MocA family protein [Jiangella sp. DSM 45060]|uniref:Gfo/Idh/MocA family protein n=1 Tax=Jiangella sp. DSM 45060 TaxID=1798224 RepID=UPI00087DD8B3|nr:Gfo/Idh/MocA family oxidoreductase [Jiangella sp. DSM 45060]SDT53041.1 Predicted dehydrogenase [Jiangella sp. DSM 45060]
MRPIGIAILGAAHTTHAWAYARALSGLPDVRVTGVHDAVPAHAQWIRRDFGVPFVASAEALVAAPDVDAVIVCGATVDHRAHVELAAAHGRHVLCEKPLATTVSDASAIVAACDAAGVQLHVAFMSRFLPLVGRARAAVRAGRLGELIGLVGGNRGRPPLPPSYPPWITDPVAAGGGALIDHSVHVTDAMRHVSGLEVTEVSAEAGSLLWDRGVDDVAVLALRFGNGAVGSVDPSWSVPDGNPWDYDFYLRLVGTEGSLDLTDAAESLRVVSVRDGGPRGLRLASFAEDADRAMLAAFAGSVRAGAVQDPCATGEDGLRALEIALAGYRSAARHAPMIINDPTTQRGSDH